MESYIDAGRYVIMTMSMLWAVCSVVVLMTLLIAFITDEQAEMPPLFRLIPFRDDYKPGLEDISWFTLFQVVGVGLLVVLVSMFLWPLYIAMAVLYSARAAYRHRETIMKFLGAIMSSRMASPTSMLREEKPLEGIQFMIEENSVKEPRWARPPPSEEIE